MARSKATTEEIDGEEAEAVDEMDDSLAEPDRESLEDGDIQDDIDIADDDDDDSWSEDDDDDEDGEKSDEESAEDLDELESEELEMLTEDELAETLVVDEAAEMRAIRRAELAMSDETGSERGADEFLCQGCFLVVATSQLRDKRRKLCVDCAS